MMSEQRINLADLVMTSGLGLDEAKKQETCLMVAMASIEMEEAGTDTMRIVMGEGTAVGKIVLTIERILNTAPMEV